MDALDWSLLAAVLLALWLAAGLADYACHARTGLATTSGVPESAMHLMQTAQVGVPMLGVLFFALTPLLLALMALGVVAHTVTAFADVRYTLTRRRIPALEHVIHAWLILLPWIGLALVLARDWPATRTVLSGAGSPEAWTLRWAPAFSGGTIALVLTASVFFGLLPGVLEFVHAWRVRPPRGGAHVNEV